MNSSFTYFFILAASLAGPFLLSFDRKVHFYKKWRYLFPAMLIPAFIYIYWDIYFTHQGVWRFSEQHTIGTKFSNLPIEEVLFFFVVPYCCVFIYECIRCYFPNLKDSRKADWILKVIGILSFIVGIIFYQRYYTHWTFVLTALFIGVIYLFRRFFKDFDAYSFLISYAICLIPFLLVNGFLTAIPVVIYNDTENLSTRIHTIPVEDIFYGMLLVLMNIVIYEKLRNRKSARAKLNRV